MDCTVRSATGEQIMTATLSRRAPKTGQQFDLLTFCLGSWTVPANIRVPRAVT